MRILVLTKRQYTGKDLLDDRYGRLFEIPSALSAKGHEILGLALSYRRRTPYLAAGSKEPRWLSVNLLPDGAWRYPRALMDATAKFSPDVIWACSDAFHAMIGAWISRVRKVPVVIDLYDNFESFTATRFPGVSHSFRAACRNAAAITCVSHALREYVLEHYRIECPAIVVGNGVRSDLFYPRDRIAARKHLGLPVNGRTFNTIVL
jgi:glycosyltransferase involved in cell wall biosynthesis